MFLGVIPPPLRAMIAERVSEWGDTVHIGCSGNFTIERTTNLVAPNVALIGNDVSIYTCVIGQIQAGQDPRLVVKEEHREAWGWLDEFLTTPEDKAACLLAVPALAEAKSKAYRSTFWEREAAHQEAQFPLTHEESKRRFVEKAIKLKSFFSMDVVDFVDQVVPKGGSFVSFPPFYGGGYEKMWEGAEEIFDWDAPSYEMFNPDSITEFVAAVEEKCEHWLIGAIKPVGDRERIGYIEASLSAMPFHVYGTHDAPKRLVTAKSNFLPSAVARHSHGDVLDGGVGLMPMPSQQFEFLRRKYMGRNVQMGGAAPDIGLGVISSGKLIGLVGFNLQPIVGTQGVAPGRSTFLVVDLAFPSDYKRLSRLVVAAACSREAREICEAFKKIRIQTIATTAFSKHSSPMKYRGKMEVISREPAKHDPSLNKVLLSGPFGTDTLAEVWADWKENHGQRT